MNANDERAARAFLASMLVVTNSVTDALTNFRSALRCIEEWGDQVPPAVAGEIGEQVDLWLLDMQRLRGELAIRSKAVASGVNVEASK